MELIYLSPSSSVIPAGSKTSQACTTLLYEESSGQTENPELISRCDKSYKRTTDTKNEIQATKGICPGLNQPSDNFSFLNL